MLEFHRLGVQINLGSAENFLANGQSRKMRIKPWERGYRATVSWWRPGEKVDPKDLPDKGMFALVKGTDLAGKLAKDLVRIRQLQVPLPRLSEPWPADEALIMPCIQASDLDEKNWPRMRSQRRNPVTVRTGCLEFAE